MHQAIRYPCSHELAASRPLKAGLEGRALVHSCPGFLGKLPSRFVRWLVRCLDWTVEEVMSPVNVQERIISVE